MTRLRLKQYVFLSWGFVLVCLSASVFYRTSPLVNPFAERLGEILPLVEPIGAALVQQLVVMGPMLIAKSNRNRVNTTTSWIIIGGATLYSLGMMMVIGAGIIGEQLTLVQTVAGGLEENAAAIGVYQRWLMPFGLFPVALLYTVK